MAGVLGALSPYVMKLITDMAQEEVSMLLGVSGEISRLEENMGSLECTLQDAERRCITEERVQRWVRKLKDVMYEATNIIDLCQLEAHKWRQSRGGSMEENVPVCGQSLLFCLRNPKFAHKIGRQIKKLNQRLDQICSDANKLNFVNLGSNREWTNDFETYSYRTRSQVDESAIVGEQIEKDMRELIQVLTTDDDNNHSIKVVSIFGAGGMGKTTLAQKIFNHQTIKEHFNTKIWLCINKHFDEVELLRRAIENAGGKHGGNQDKSTLTDILFNILSNGRFLLVMDDVWSQKAWNDILNVPVRNASNKQLRSWVLVTTRSAHLPEQMQAALHQHRVNPLDKHDSWSLLKKQLNPHQADRVDHQLKIIGMKILEKCNGLPLAIKVIGGLLKRKYVSQLQWEAVLNSPKWSVVGLPDELNRPLYLSYEDLCPELKQCFLYCAQFPKGVDIIQGVITGMWISEGFIQPPGESSSYSCIMSNLIESRATSYYRELINRNLIDPTEEHNFTGYRCTMHDVVRSFAEYIAREESVVLVGNKEQEASGAGGKQLVRRLSVGRTISVVKSGTLQRRKSIRTLIIINSRVQFQLGKSLHSFTSLRVLYIWSIKVSDVLVASLSKLKHLRYLYIEDTDISKVRKGINKMKFLQYIYLLKSGKLDHFVSSISGLVNLRSLDITGSEISVVPKGFSGLINLRTLFGFPVKMHMDTGTSSRRCSLQELAPLIHLEELSLVGLGALSAGWMAETARISSKDHLSYLKMDYSASTHTSDGPQQLEVLDKLCPPACLENLTVTGGYIGDILPTWMHAPRSAEFRSLRYLTLEKLQCCTQLPDGLCCLQNLELLIIKNAPAIKRIRSNFQAPPSMAMEDGADATLAPFPRLRELKLIGLSECEEWEWNDCEGHSDVKAAVAMPCLETLIIENCKLRCLPPGLSSNKRHALRKLHLYNLSKLTFVENFHSVVGLDVFDCPELKRISGLSMLQKIRIFCCPKMEVLEAVPSLDSMEMKDGTMETLPEYLTAVNLRYLKLSCRKKLYESSLTRCSSEYHKISHIKSRNICPEVEG